MVHSPTGSERVAHPRIVGKVHLINAGMAKGRNRHQTCEVGNNARPAQVPCGSVIGGGVPTVQQPSGNDQGGVASQVGSRTNYTVIGGFRVPGPAIGRIEIELLVNVVLVAEVEALPSVVSMRFVGHGIALP